MLFHFLLLCCDDIFYMCAILLKCSFGKPVVWSEHKVKCIWKLSIKKYSSGFYSLNITFFYVPRLMSLCPELTLIKLIECGTSELRQRLTATTQSRDTRKLRHLSYCIYYFSVFLIILCWRKGICNESWIIAPTVAALCQGRKEALWIWNERFT